MSTTVSYMTNRRLAAQAVNVSKAISLTHQQAQDIFNSEDVPLRLHVAVGGLLALQEVPN